MEQLSPTLAPALEAWRAMHAGTPYPMRNAFDPLAFRSLLGRLSLLQVFRDPWRFRYRIHGTETARWVGYDLTGKYLDEGSNKEWIELGTKHLAEVANLGLPSLEQHFNVHIGYRLLNVEALVLPLSTDGHLVDYLISILIPHTNDAAWRAHRPHSEFHILRDTAPAATTTSKQRLRASPI